MKPSKTFSPGIRSSLLVAMTLLIVGLLTSLTVIQFRSQKRIQEQDLNRRIDLMKEVLHERGMTLARDLAHEVENDLALLNYSKMAERINGVIERDDELHYIIVMDERRFVYLHSIRPDLEKTILDDPGSSYGHEVTTITVRDSRRYGKDVMEFTTPLYFGDTFRGRLLLGFSQDKLNAEIVDSQREIGDRIREQIFQFMATAVVFIVIGAIVILIISDRLTRPIIQLTKMAKELTRGNFSVTENLNVHAGKEIGVLASAFREMSDGLQNYSRNLEDKVAERTRELSLALENLKRTQRQLIESEKMASLGNLVAGVAHEINTPVGVGITAASTLHDNMEQFADFGKTNTIKRSDLVKIIDNSRENAQLILSNLERASELIQSFKQIAVDQSTEDMRAINVRTYVDEVLLSLRPQVKHTVHTIDCRCDDSLVIVSYPGVLSQILTNLILNSVVHGFDAQRNGTITIDIVCRDGELILNFADDGKGIAKAHLPHIFEPFYTTKQGTGGSGLGLHIVYNLVTQKLNGTIKCESEADIGTRFEMRMPAQRKGERDGDTSDREID